MSVSGPRADSVKSASQSPHRIRASPCRSQKRRRSEVLPTPASPASSTSRPPESSAASSAESSAARSRARSPGPLRQTSSPGHCLSSAAANASVVDFRARRLSESYANRDLTQLHDARRGRRARRGDGHDRRAARHRGGARRLLRARGRGGRDAARACDLPGVGGLLAHVDRPAVRGPHQPRAEVRGLDDARERALGRGTAARPCSATTWSRRSASSSASRARTSASTAASRSSKRSCTPTCSTSCGSRSTP